jgi:hypothetical protein
MDLSPIYLSEFQFKDIKIIPNRKIKLFPYLCDKGRNIRIEYEPWALCVSGEDRPSLIKELREHLYVNWIEFAEEDDSNLDRHALKIKYRLIEDLSAFKSSNPITN